MSEELEGAFLVLESEMSDGYLQVIEFYPDGDIWADAKGQTFKTTWEQRRALVTHLLEAEARERVVVCREYDNSLRVAVDGCDVAVNKPSGRLMLIDHGNKSLDAISSESLHRLALACAALAEKRRKESEVRGD